MEQQKMTTLQKLVRVAELGIAMDKEPSPAIVAALNEKRAEILVGVSYPPAALIGNPDPQAWAEQFALFFADVTAESCYAWLSNAMLAGAQAAQTPSYEAGRAEGMKQAAEGFKEMADLLAFIRAGYNAGRIKSPSFVDPTAIVGQAKTHTLADQIATALTAAGLE